MILGWHGPQLSRTHSPMPLAKAVLSRLRNSHSPSSPAGDASIQNSACLFKYEKLLHVCFRFVKFVLDSVIVGGGLNYIKVEWRWFCLCVAQQRTFCLKMFSWRQRRSKAGTEKCLWCHKLICINFFAFFCLCPIWHFILHFLHHSTHVITVFDRTCGIC